MAVRCTIFIVCILRSASLSLLEFPLSATSPLPFFSSSYFSSSYYVSKFLFSEVNFVPSSSFFFNESYEELYLYALGRPSTGDVDDVNKHITLDFANNLTICFGTLLIPQPRNANPWCRAVWPHRFPVTPGGTNYFAAVVDDDGVSWVTTKPLPTATPKIVVSRFVIGDNWYCFVDFEEDQTALIVDVSRSDDQFGSHFVNMFQTLLELGYIMLPNCRIEFVSVHSLK